MGNAALPGGSVGGRIAQARLQAAAARGRAFTQTELGRQVGVAPATVSQWEAGASIPSLETIVKIAASLGVTPGFIAFGETTQPATEGGPLDYTIGAVALTPAQIARAQEADARKQEELRQAAERERGAPRRGTKGR